LGNDGGPGSVTFLAAPVPEPSSILALGMSAGALLVLRRRRRC
jgi:hypothetical protein